MTCAFPCTEGAHHILRTSGNGPTIFGTSLYLKLAYYILATVRVWSDGFSLAPYIPKRHLLLEKSHPAPNFSHFLWGGIFGPSHGALTGVEVVNLVLFGITDLFNDVYKSIVFGHSSFQMIHALEDSVLG